MPQTSSEELNSLAGWNKSHMEKGFIKIWRKYRDEPFANDPLAVACYVRILVECEWQAGRQIFFRGQTITLQPGQMTCGRNQLASWVGITPAQARTCRSKLKKAKKIAIEPANKFSLITVIDWDKEQGNSQQTPNKSPADSQRVATLEEFKNSRIQEKNSPLRKNKYARLQS